MRNPLSPEDEKWLTDLEKAVVKKSHDNFGHIHRFAERLLTKKEEDKLLGLIKEHELPCVLDSGPYGDLSLWICERLHPSEYSPA